MNPNFKPPARSKLLEATLKLLNEDERSMLQISQDSDLSFYWLRSLKTRRNADPSINRVEQLYVFLSGKELDV